MPFVNSTHGENGFARVMGRLLIVAGLIAVAFGRQTEVAALTPSPWTSESVVSTGLTGGSQDTVAVDASEDGSIVGALWSETSGFYGFATAAVAWTDGTQINWSTPIRINKSSTASSYYLSISVSGDGRTVYAAWTEQSGNSTNLDDVTYAVGAISVDPTTKVPTVTWGASGSLTYANHQWWPSIDSNYDGTKFIVGFMNLATSTYFQASVGTVVVSGSSRVTTWKGPTDMSSILNVTYTPSASYQALWRPSIKMSRDGVRVVAAWWNGNGVSYGNAGAGYGRAQASFGTTDLSSLALWQQTAGSQWSFPVNLSTSTEASSFSMPAIDFNDAGTRAVVAWAGKSGSNEYVSASVATLTGNISGAWTTEEKLVENLSRPATYVTANIDANGTRAYASWNTGPDYADAGTTMATVGSIDTSGNPTWNAASTIQAGFSYYGVNRSRMSRDGSTAIVFPLIRQSSKNWLKSTSTNIWSNGTGLQTDWESTLGEVTSVTSEPDVQSGMTIAKDGSIITIVWRGGGKLWSRTAAVGSPLPTSISPTNGTEAGGETVTITGTGFRPGASVLVNNVACTSVVVVSSTSITCVVPPGSGGAFDVKVTNINSVFGTLVNAYTYNAPATTTIATTPTTTVAPTNQNSTGTTTSGSQGGSTSNSNSTNGVTATTLASLGNSQGVNIAPSPSLVADLPLGTLATVDPTSLLPGGKVTLTADGFSSGEQVVVGVSEDASTAQMTKASGTGRVATKVKLPLKLGKKITVYAMGMTSKHGYRQVMEVRQQATLPTAGGGSTPMMWVGIALMLFGTVTLIGQSRLRR